MGNVKIETNGICQNSKSYIVASRILKGLRFQSTDWSNVHHFELVLSDPQDEPDLAHSSTRGQKTCNSIDYTYCLST